MKEWQECINYLQEKLPNLEFDIWIKPLKCLINKNNINIIAPDKNHMEYIKSKYLNSIYDFFLKIDKNYKFKISFDKLENSSAKDGFYQLSIFDNEFETLENEEDNNFNDYLDTIEDIPQDNFNYSNNYLENDNKLELNKKDERIETKNLNSLKENYTFESFIAGKSNEIAKASAIAVAGNPGKLYNPLFLYGNSGLGKTHLLHSIGNEIYKHNKNAKIIYTTSESFLRDFITSINSKDKDIKNFFREKYRNTDVLLVDDIQFLIGKKGFQEEFFHTFNELLEKQSQIILTSDCYPKELKGIDDRLKTRFNQGLIMTIEVPEFETRTAIILEKSKKYNNLNVSYEVAMFIAENIRSNVRELEGALLRIENSAKIKNVTEITINFAKEVLKDTINVQETLIKVDNIQKTVANFYKITVKDLLSSQRVREIARPRHIAMSLSKELTNHSLPEIGNFFGGKTHSTVINAIERIKNLRKYNKKISDDYDKLLRILTS